MLPHRRFSVHESLNADFFVFAVKESSEGDGFDFHPVGQPFIKGGAHRLLSDTKGVSGFASNTLGHGKDGFLQVFG